MTIRRYHWQTDRSKEQVSFLTALVKVYRTYTKGQSPELINFPPVSESRPIPTASASSDSINNSAYDYNAGSPSATPSNLDLRPPQMPKTQRSGSNSSFASAQSSSYQSEQGQGSRSRLIDQRQHTPRAESFSRSPLADSNIPPARTSFDRRPSGDSRLTPVVSNGHGRGGSGSGSPSPYGHSNGSGIGLGAPTSGSGRNGDRPSNPQREMSETSTYQERSDRAHRPSMERLQQNARPASPASPERPIRPSRGLPKGSVDMVSGGSGSGSRDQISRPSTSDRRDNVPPPLQSQLAPTITTTLPSPALPSAETLAPTPTESKRPTRRASFHPPPLQTAFSREVLLTSRTGLLPGAGLTVDDGEAKEDAIMASVEEMLEGFDWTASAANGEGGVKKRGADAIEGRLLDELAALDSVGYASNLDRGA